MKAASLLKRAWLAALLLSTAASANPMSNDYWNSLDLDLLFRNPNWGVHGREMSPADVDRVMKQIRQEWDAKPESKGLTTEEQEQGESYFQCLQNGLKGNEPNLAWSRCSQRHRDTALPDRLDRLGLARFANSSPFDFSALGNIWGWPDPPPPPPPRPANTDTGGDDNPTPEPPEAPLQMARQRIHDVKGYVLSGAFAAAVRRNVAASFMRRTGRAEKTAGGKGTGGALTRLRIGRPTFGRF